jgi:hypothetical protein
LESLKIQHTAGIFKFKSNMEISNSY